jgi:FlgD Ig-like domain
VSRFVPAGLVAALLIATGLAFAETERLKLTPSPIVRTSVTKTFSPVCECDTDVATIGFSLRRRDTIDVDIVDRSGVVVRSLVRSTPEARGPVEIYWNGHDDSGAIAVEGNYRARVRLARQRRTIVLPNPISLDVTRPRFVAYAIRPKVFSPDGDGRNEKVVGRYRLSERAQVALYVDGERQVLRRGSKQRGTVQWLGFINGKRVRPGAFSIVLGATDLAGNISERTPPTIVVARSVALGRKRIDAVVGRPFAVLVVSDAGTVAWKLGQRHGTIHPGTLRLRAPVRAGRYWLVVTANGNSARARVIVRQGAPGE